MEYIVVLHPSRKGPFRRRIDGIRMEFEAKQAVQLTEKQLLQVVSDLGSALVLVDEFKDKKGDKEVVSYVPNWLQTKIMAVQSAEHKIETAEKSGANPAELMSPFEQACWDRRDEIAAEYRRDTEKVDVADELTEFLDLSIESVEFLIANGLPVGESKFDNGAVNEWIKSEVGAPFFAEARKMTEGASDDGGQNEPIDDQPKDEDSKSDVKPIESDDEDEEDEEEIKPVELSSQAKLADHFRVSKADVKAWVKDGLTKEGDAYMSSEVYEWLKANSKLGEDLSADFDEVNDLGLEVFTLDSELKVFTNFGTIIHDEELKSAEDVGKLLAEITSDLPEEEIGTE